GRFERECDPAPFGCGLEVRGSEANQTGQVGTVIAHRHLPRFKACDIEQVVYVLEQEISVPTHHLEPSALFRGERLLLEELINGAEDQRQRGAELVADVGEELSLQLVRLLEPLVRLLQI